MDKKILVFGVGAIIRCTKNTFFWQKFQNIFFSKFFPEILLFFFSKFFLVIKKFRPHIPADFLAGHRPFPATKQILKFQKYPKFLYLPEGKFCDFFFKNKIFV